MKCFGCGVEKDLNALEVSPHHLEDGIVDEPIPPLMVIDCNGADHFRIVVVCHECFHRLNVDLWISERCWKQLNPVVPFEQLPLNELEGDEKWDPANYHIG